MPPSLWPLLQSATIQPPGLVADKGSRRNGSPHLSGGADGSAHREREPGAPPPDGSRRRPAGGRGGHSGDAGECHARPGAPSRRVSVNSGSSERLRNESGNSWTPQAHFGGPEKPMEDRRRRYESQPKRRQPVAGARFLASAPQLSELLQGHT